MESELQLVNSNAKARNNNAEIFVIFILVNKNCCFYFYLDAKITNILYLTKSF